VLSCGADRTCRVWKIPEESQLIFRHDLKLFFFFHPACLPLACLPRCVQRRSECAASNTGGPVAGCRPRAV
jgi:hypothetical protein